MGADKYRRTRPRRARRLVARDARVDRRQRRPRRVRDSAHCRSSAGTPVRACPRAEDDQESAAPRFPARRSRRGSRTVACAWRYASGCRTRRAVMGGAGGPRGQRVLRTRLTRSLSRRYGSPWSDARLRDRAPWALEPRRMVSWRSARPRSPRPSSGAASTTPAVGSATSAPRQKAGTDRASWSRRWVARDVAVPVAMKPRATRQHEMGLTPWPSVGRSSSSSAAGVYVRSATAMRCRSRKRRSVGLAVSSMARS